MKSLMIGFLFILAGCDLSRKINTRPYTREELRNWSERNRDVSSWHGWVLYQGSDSAKHYFIGRVMDEWNWMEINRGELFLEDERPHLSASSRQLGFYFVDPLNGFVKAKDY